MRNDRDRVGEPTLRETFVDLLLEERFDAPSHRSATAGAAPQRARRVSRLLAAALLLAGTGVVVGVAVERRASREAAQQPQDPQPQPQDPTRQDGRALPTDARAFVPLRLGDRWTYRDTIVTHGLEGGRERKVVVEATAVVDIGGAQVVQLCELDDGDGIAFSYWRGDGKGVFRLLPGNMVQDPVFQKVVDEASLELPSPVGAETRWTVRRAPVVSLPRFGAGRTPTVHAADVVELQAELAGTAVEVVGARDAAGGEPARWTALHVHVAGDDAHGDEDHHYARGVGLVRSVRREGNADVLRELVRFEPAAPAPDRAAVLAGLVGAERAAGARWLDVPADSPAAWTVRSAFALVPDGERTTVVRVLGDRAVAFDPQEVASWAAIVRDEGATARMRGLFVQRVAQGLLWLCEQLDAATSGETVAQTGEFSCTIAMAKSTVREDVTITARDGTTAAASYEIELRNGIPSRIGRVAK